MGIFVDERGQPVRVGANTIYVRTEYTARQSVVLASLQQAIAAGEADAAERLLAIIIADWEGPDFEGIPCTPENVARLNMADPLVRAALAAYQEIMAAIADPKSTPPATAGGGQHSRAGSRAR